MTLFCKFNPYTEEVQLCSLSCICKTTSDCEINPEPPDPTLNLDTIFELDPSLAGGLDYMDWTEVLSDINYSVTL